MGEPELLRVSYSSLAVFSSCPRKFEFNKLYPKRVRADDTDDWYAADVGTALHAGYQEYLTSQDEEAAIWAFMLKFPYESEWNQKNDFRNFDAALSTLCAMLEEVRMDEYELVHIRRPNTSIELESGLKGGVVVPAIEVPFEIRFKGISIPPCRRFPYGANIALTGYIDAVLRHHMTGLYRSTDIKTSRMALKDATGKYKFDGQQVPYGIVIDHIAQESVEAFDVLYFDCYIDLLEPKIQLYPFRKTQDDLQEWLANTVIKLQAIQRFAATDYFPRTDNGCMFYNSPCRYLEPCQTRDRESLNVWFLMGEEPAPQEEFLPWIVAEIDVGLE